jgi:hypothetical protein
MATARWLAAVLAGILAAGGATARDNGSGSLLFAGRLADPRAK